MALVGAICCCVSAGQQGWVWFGRCAWTLLIRRTKTSKSAFQGLAFYLLPCWDQRGSGGSLLLCCSVCRAPTDWRGVRVSVAAGKGHTTSFSQQLLCLHMAWPTSFETLLWFPSWPVTTKSVMSRRVHCMQRCLAVMLQRAITQLNSEYPKPLLNTTGLLVGI